MAVREQAHGVSAAEPVEQTKTNCGFACSRLADEQRESLIVVDSLEKLGKSAFVRCGCVVGLGAGSGPEWPTQQAEVSLVHGQYSPSSARRRTEPRGTYR